MSSRNQYKALLTKTKQELSIANRDLRASKKAHERMVEQIVAANHKCGLLGAELGRVRSRKWFQFWKFFKRNRLI